MNGQSGPFDAGDGYAPPGDMVSPEAFRPFSKYSSRCEDRSLAGRPLRAAVTGFKVVKTDARRRMGKP